MFLYCIARPSVFLFCSLQICGTQFAQICQTFVSSLRQWQDATNLAAASTPMAISLKKIPFFLYVDPGCYNNLLSNRSGHRGLGFAGCPVEVYWAAHHHTHGHSHRPLWLPGGWRESWQTLGHRHAVSMQTLFTEMSRFTPFVPCEPCPLLHRTIFLVLLFSQYARNIQLPLPIYKSKKGWTSYRLQLFKMFPVSVSRVIQDMSGCCCLWENYLYGFLSKWNLCHDIPKHPNANSNIAFESLCIRQSWS